MHIGDGILPPVVWAGGHVLAGGAVALALARFDERRIPEIGVLTSVFFVASLVHVPLGGVAVHFQLTGLLGIVLGPLAWPAVLVALFLQAALFFHGAITTLGVNTVVMGAGATASYWVFRAARGRGRARSSSAAAGLAAFAATLAGFAVSSALFVVAMALGDKELRIAAGLYVVPHFFLALIEAAVTSAAVGFLWRVKPELVGLRRASAVAPEMTA